MVVSKLRGTSWFNFFSDISKCLDVEDVDEQIQYIPVQYNIHVIRKCKNDQCPKKIIPLVLFVLISNRYLLFFLRCLPKRLK